MVAVGWRGVTFVQLRPSNSHVSLSAQSVRTGQDSAGEVSAEDHGPIQDGVEPHGGIGAGGEGRRRGDRFPLWQGGIRTRPGRGGPSRQRVGCGETGRRRPHVRSRPGRCRGKSEPTGGHDEENPRRHAQREEPSERPGARAEVRDPRHSDGIWGVTTIRIPSARARCRSTDGRRSSLAAGRVRRAASS